MYMGLTDEDTCLASELPEYVPPFPEDKATEYAKELAISDPASATALLEELLYWRNQGRI